MAREDRFEKVFEQGMVNVTEIWVDRVTGVQYVFHASGSGSAFSGRFAPGSRAAHGAQ